MRFSWLIVSVLASALWAVPASARTATEVDHTYEQAWQAAVRLVRVDLGCTLTDRDAENGYILFEYTQGGRTVPGAIELVRIETNGVTRIRVVVQVSAMPSYVERMILDRMLRKLREDYGEVRTRRRVAPSEPSEPPAATPPAEEVPTAPPTT